MENRHQPHILIVEDDPVIRKVLDLQLASHGFRVTSAADGAAGYAALQEALPDCVVLDLMMPVMDGFSLLKRIRSVGRTASLPVIILTASMEDRHRLRGQQYQADAYLNKPYELEQLLATVRRFCGAPQELPI